MQRSDSGTIIDVIAYIVIIAVFTSPLWGTWWIVATLMNRNRKMKEAEAEVARIASLERERQNKSREDYAIQKIMFVTDRDYRSGYRMLREVRWLTAINNSQEDAERALKLQASNNNANAIIKLKFRAHTSKEQAGVSPKGNPYYTSHTTRSWEGLAVVVEANTKPLNNINIAHSSPYSAPIFTVPLTTSIIIDGNNILLSHHSVEKPAVLKAVIAGIQSSGRPLHLYMDANGPYLIFGNGQRRSNAEVAAYLNIGLAQLSFSPRGEKADPYILEKAKADQGTILSNDHYSEYESEFPWIRHPNRKIGLSVANQRIIVPALKLSIDFSGYSPPDQFTLAK